MQAEFASVAFVAFVMDFRLPRPSLRSGLAMTVAFVAFIASVAFVAFIAFIMSSAASLNI